MKTCWILQLAVLWRQCMFSVVVRRCARRSNVRFCFTIWFIWWICSLVTSVWIRMLLWCGRWWLGTRRCVRCYSRLPLLVPWCVFWEFIVRQLCRLRSWRLYCIYWRQRNRMLRWLWSRVLLWRRVLHRWRPLVWLQRWLLLVWKFWLCSRITRLLRCICCQWLLFLIWLLWLERKVRKSGFKHVVWSCFISWFCNFVHQHWLCNQLEMWRCWWVWSVWLWSMIRRR